MRLDKYKMRKVTPSGTELKAYLYQVVSFIDKRSFIFLAAHISEYMEEQKMFDHNGEFYYAFWVVPKLSGEQVRSILTHFNILPEYLYYHEDDANAGYASGAGNLADNEEKINRFPTFYGTLREVQMENGSILLAYTAGESLVNVISGSGEMLKPASEQELNSSRESDYFQFCKISYDKKSILLHFLGRYASWIQYAYKDNRFIFMHAGYSWFDEDNSPEGYYEDIEIDGIYESRIRELEERKSAPVSVAIGSQEWMRRNLDTEKFQNGDLIPQAATSEEWEQAALSHSPAWCYYDNNMENGDRYGKLYNWYAVADSRGLAPEGWHIPSLDEWESLLRHLGEGHNIRLKGCTQWKNDDVLRRFLGNLGLNDGTEGCFGNNTSPENITQEELFNSTGFTALPAGARGVFGNAFFGKGDSAYWWTATEKEGSEEDDEKEREAYFVLLYVHDADMQTGNYGNKKSGYAVRCVRDLV